MRLGPLGRWLPLGLIIATGFSLAAWSLVEGTAESDRLERELMAALAVRGEATQEALLLLSGRSWSFDALTSHTQRLRTVTGWLEERLPDGEAIAALADDPEGIERFKTDFAAYRKSVEAVGAIAQQLAPVLDDSPLQAVSAPFREFHAAKTIGAMKAADRDAEIARLLASVPDDSPEAKRLELFASHLRLIAERSESIQRGLEELLDGPTREQVASLLRDTQAAQVAAVRRMEIRERISLLLLAFATAYVVSLAIESQRTANKRKELNDQLEVRVAERTAALNREHNLLGSIISGLPNAVFWKNEAGAYAGCNQAFVDFVGEQDQSQVIGATDHDLAWSDDTRQSKLEKERRVVESRAPLTDLHTKKERRDGTVFDVVASKNVLTDADGRVCGLVGIYTDVTELNQLRDQVQQADKMQAVGRLAAGIAHEINTPIQTASGNIEFLRSAIDQLLGLVDVALEADAVTIDEKAASWLKDNAPGAVEDSDEALRRVTEIVGAMRVMSHPGGDRTAKADINTLVQSAATISRNRWKYAAELETEFDEGLAEIECDPSEISQVLLNLIVNAGDAIADNRADADPLGKIVCRTSAADGGVVVEIEDNGGGIPKEIRKQVFEPFFTTKEVGRGTGQGLAIAYDAIAVKHGGTIDFETTAGVGTTFRIWLPSRPVGAPNAAEVAEAIAP